MDVPIRYNWSDKKEKLENVLDDFNTDGVIKNWEYTDSFDESVVGKKGWYKDLGQLQYYHLSNRQLA